MRSRWVEREAAGQPDLAGLLYASRLVGADASLVVWGGGNTSAKLTEADYRGREVRVLRIKGSGSDLKTIRLNDFPGVRLDDVLALQSREGMPDEEMVAYLGHTLMEPSSPRPSIETLLHAFLPSTFVIHTHADAILALTNTPSGRRWVMEALGPGAVWVPYQRPGFALSKLAAEECGAARRSARGATCIVLEKHGLITWGETAREAYETTIEIVTRADAFIAERRALRPAPTPPKPMFDLDAAARRRVYVAIAPLIRGLAARTLPDGSVAQPAQTFEPPSAARVLLRLDDSEDLLAFASDPRSQRLSQIGPATPDHLMNTKRVPLYVPVPRDSARCGERTLAEAIEQALEIAWTAWARDYVRYVEVNKASGKGAAPERVDPRPRVVLLPGIGVVTLGKDARAARVAGEIYHHAVATIRDADAVESYASLSEQDCFDVEYWPMELYKLTLAPAEAELARRIALVTGAASGIGRAIAARLCREGAHVVVSDVNLDGARSVAEELRAARGADCAIAVRTDVASEDDARSAYAATVEAFGGLDILVSNAGIAPCSSIDQMRLEDWQRSFDVNSTGHFLMTREAITLLKRQGLGGSLIYIATKNTMAPGKEFGAYSAAKAAQAQLARVAALEGGAYSIRANMINPDAVFRGSTLWSPELRSARAKAHGFDEEGLEEYYRRRNLLGVAIYPEDVAEAAWWLATDRSRKTTGGVITVDGGVAAAFPR